MLGVFHYLLFNLFFSYRIAGKAYAQLLKYLVINLAQHYGAMHLATIEFRKLFERFTTVVVGDAQH